MSLIAHYNLNGNPDDLTGKYDGFLSGSASYTGGKVGDCLAVTRGVGNHLEVPHDPVLSARLFGKSTTMSYSFWAKISTWTSYGCIIAKATGGSWSNTTSGVWIYSGGIRFIHGVNTGGNAANSISYIDYKPALDVWVHIACVSDENTMWMYADGSLVGTTTINITERSENTSPIMIGGARYPGANEGVNGFIDDLRMYDHALSEREVRDLARGIAANYSFDRKAQYTKNVVTNTNLDTGWSKGYAKNIIFDEIAPPPGVDSPTVGFEDSDANGNCYWYSYGDYAPQEPGKLYAASVWMKVQGGSVGIRMYTANNSETGRYYSEYIYVTDSDGWKRVEWDVFRNASDSQSDSMSFRFASMTTERVWLCAPQLELNHHTPFVDGIREDFISDNSGNWPKAVLDNNCPQWISGDDISFGAYRFNGVDNAITVTNSPTVLGSTSIAFWLFPTSTARQTIWDKGYGGEGTINFESTNQNLRLYSGPNGNNSSGYQSVNSGSMPLNEWTHAVVTREMPSGTVKWYLNGQLSTTGAFSFTTIGETTFNLTIGNGYTSGFEGSLSQVKQYTAVLTADEVKSLYQTGLAVDDHHRMHSAYLNELFEFDYLSPKSSSEVASAGNGYNATSGESDPCSGLLTFDDAVAYAEAQGGRLPTLDEMINGATAGSGCGYDNQYCWTCTKGVDDSEHWVAYGKYDGTELPEEVRQNTQTAYVRFVFDNDLERLDPVTIDDAAVQKVVGSGATKIERCSTKKDQFSEVGITRGLVSYFPLNGDAKDRVSNEVATVTGATPTGDGYSFDGVDDWIEPQGLTSTDVLCEPSNQFTICARFNYADSDLIRSIFGASGGYGGYATFVVGVDQENNIRIVLKGNSSSPLSGLSANTDYFICVTWDGDTALVYLNDSNGVSVNVGTAGDQQLGLAIGQHRSVYPSSNYPFSGSIKGFKYFDKTLTPEEVAQEYESSSKSMINRSTAFAKEFIEV